MPKIILTVRAIVEYRKKVLIIKERFDRGYFWTIPGGTFEVGKDKNLISAVKRELFEEVGFKKVKILDLLGMRQYDIGKDFKIVFIYKVKPLGSVKIKLGNVRGIKNEDIVDYRWISKKDFSKISKSGFINDRVYGILKDLWK